MGQGWGSRSVEGSRLGSRSGQGVKVGGESRSGCQGRVVMVGGLGGGVRGQLGLVGGGLR